MHAIHLPDADPEAATLEIRGEERDHAVKSRRLRVGEEVVVLDGAGLCLYCQVEGVGAALTLRVADRARREPVSPAIEVWSPAPKGPRASAMVDMLSQVGAASWTPMRTAFTPKEATDARLERLRRVAVESMKQSQRPWLMAINEPREYDDALDPEGGVEIIVADAFGDPGGRPTHAGRIRLLIGPEGGWREDEAERARAVGASVRSFGPHVLRLETAAPVAAAVLLALRSA